MSITRRLFVTALCLAVLPSFAAAMGPQIGQPAPDFTGTGSNGENVHLTDLKGNCLSASLCP